MLGSAIVITISTRAAAGVYEDRSGPAIEAFERIANLAKILTLKSARAVHSGRPMTSHNACHCSSVSTEMASQRSNPAQAYSPWGAALRTRLPLRSSRFP